MRQRPPKKKRSVGRVMIALVFVLTVLWGGSLLLPGNPQPAAIEDHPIGFELAPDLQINSSNAVLMNLDSGKILFDRDSMAKMNPASMTKIMTAVVALDNLGDLSETIVLNEWIYHDIYEENASTAGFLPNEKVQVIDLLYGLLLPSGAECAIGLAEHVAGSESAFAELMNEKARELGMNGTHFVNTTGLDDAQHYSTVSDIASLLKYALKNKVFYEIFTSASHTSKPTRLHPDGITFYSTMFSRMESTEFNGVKILGGKTGYTDEAGQCLASLSEKDGVRFILVTCGAPGNNKTQALHIDDAVTVYAAVGDELE